MPRESGKGAPVLRLMDYKKPRQDDTVAVLRCLLAEALNGEVAGLTLAVDRGPDRFPDIVRTTTNERGLYLAARITYRLASYIEDEESAD